MGAPDDQYKLYHFDVRGRAEPIRWILLANGIPFEDIRLSVKDYIKMKPELPLGNLPMLETPSGQRICQPVTILRYLGHLFGMSGSDFWEQSQVDLALYSSNDICEEMRAICQLWETDVVIDTEKRERNRKFYTDKVLPNTMEALERLLLGSGRGWLVGNRMTIADLYFVHWVEEVCLFLDRAVHVSWDRYPDLRALNQRVRATRGLSAWLRKRPTDAEELRKLTSVIGELRAANESVKV